MRLCVNRDGLRQDFQQIGDRVHEVNKLTVIASESYEAFAKGLQDEIAKTLKDRPTKADQNSSSTKWLRTLVGEPYLKWSTPTILNSA